VRRFLFIYEFPKSNVLSFKFRMRGPLKESISCFLIRLSPLVLVAIGLFHRTQRPLLYDFIGLKVLAFILHRTQSPLSLSFIGLKFLYLYAFIGLKVLCHLHFKDFNVFSHLHFQKTTMSSFSFQRFQCIQLFMLSKDYNVFIYISKT